MGRVKGEEIGIRARLAGGRVDVRVNSDFEATDDDVVFVVRLVGRPCRRLDQ